MRIDIKPITPAFTFLIFSALFSASCRFEHKGNQITVNNAASPTPTPELNEKRLPSMNFRARHKTKPGMILEDSFNQFAYLTAKTLPVGAKTFRIHEIKMKKIYNRTLIAIALIVVLSAAASARRTITKRVRLTAGSSAATLKGTLPVGDMTHVYVLRAAKNRRLKVNLTFTGRGDADFSLKRPDGKNVDEASIINSDWAGVLPQTGDYKINVFNPAQIRGAVKYTLEIRLQK